MNVGLSLKLTGAVGLSLTFLLGACRPTLETPVLQAQSEDQQLSIEVLQGIPPSSFGPHPVQIFITQRNERLLLMRTDIANDGARLSRRNVQIQFESPQVWICLRGTRQADKLVQYNAQTRDYQVREGSCEPQFTSSWQRPEILKGSLKGVAKIRN
ncbi:hypothetical protein [Lyngbya confervoides]|uniref:Lipoprotein n=1 Tax=Lyngbya confervoides BDU141951 TaxID=1574623 RepID=A0ABD4T4Q9_9CYAN|nr:hypothetical protein [Lyngbya confervoides]MCM1983445.1 hypothetical protein [Lyngbya confervoides BDU141951]